MKRSLLPAGALVLVLTACGAGVRSAPRVTEVGARLPSVDAIAVRRERAATRTADRLLREFVPPPGARRLRERPDRTPQLLRWPAAHGPGGEVADAHRFWSVPKPLRVVVAFVRARWPRGLERRARWGTAGTRRFVALTSPAANRVFDVMVVRLAGRTALRVDVQVGWVYPRARSERVPSSVREVVVRAPHVFLKVTSRGKVARIVRWLDALPVLAPPDLPVACPAVRVAEIALTFRDARGARLARARVPAAWAGLCDAIGFTIGGHRRRPLTDRIHHPSFAARLQHLLGVRLTPRGRS